jgi:hypothetical protein
MLCPTRTIPVEAGSSVLVASTDLAQRMQRSTSTEAIGREMGSMLARKGEGAERSESEEE